MLGFGQMLAAGAASVNVADVFAATTYTGNGASRTITTGIDLSSAGTAPLRQGGLVWIKVRDGVGSPRWYDTVRTLGNALNSTATGAQALVATGLSGFGTTGFNYGTDTLGNGNLQSFVAWSLRRAAGFLDVVTWTGTGAARTIAHTLGSAPGLMIVKRTDTTGNWRVYHRVPGSGLSAVLNTTAAITTIGASGYWNTADPDASVFSLGTDADVNASGGSYIGYLFGHDATASGVIQCGQYTGNGSTTGPIINLGWEPQFVMIKNASSTGNWVMMDTARGMASGADAILLANSATAETSADYITPSGTGFQIVSSNADVNTNPLAYLYLAIRRP